MKPKKSNSPSGTLQIRVFSSFTVSFSLPMIFAQAMQRRVGVAPPAQDHEVIGIGDKASAETSLKAELLRCSPGPCACAGGLVA